MWGVCLSHRILNNDNRDANNKKDESDSELQDSIREGPLWWGHQFSWQHLSYTSFCYSKKLNCVQKVYLIWYKHAVKQSADPLPITVRKWTIHSMTLCYVGHAWPQNSREKVRPPSRTLLYSFSHRRFWKWMFSFTNYNLLFSRCVNKITVVALTSKFNQNCKALTKLQVKMFTDFKI